MALSFTERRKLQKRVIEGKARLKAPDITFKEKRPLQKQVMEWLNTLGAKAKQAAKSILDQLLAGELNSLVPSAFREALVAASKLAQDWTVLRAPVAAYIEANANLVAE